MTLSVEYYAKDLASGAANTGVTPAQQFHK